MPERPFYEIYYGDSFVPVRVSPTTPYASPAEEAIFGMLAQRMLETTTGSTVIRVLGQNVAGALVENLLSVSWDLLTGEFRIGAALIDLGTDLTYAAVLGRVFTGIGGHLAAAGVGTIASAGYMGFLYGFGVAAGYAITAEAIESWFGQDAQNGIFTNSAGQRQGGVYLPQGLGGGLETAAVEHFIRQGAGGLHLGTLDFTSDNWFSVGGTYRFYDARPIYTVANALGIDVASVLAFGASGIHNERIYEDRDVGYGYFYQNLSSDFRISIPVTVAGSQETVFVSRVYDATVGSQPVIGGGSLGSGQYLYMSSAAGGRIAAQDGRSALLISNDTSQTIIGGSSADLLLGNGGNDDLDGRGGQDRVDGGGGDDFVHGAANDAALFGGTGFDTLVFSDQPGATWSVTNGGVSLAGSSARISGFEAIVGSVNGRDVFHITGSPGELHLRGGAGGGDDYYFSGDFSRVTLEDTGIGDRLFIDGFLLAGEAVQTERGSQTYALNGFLITWAGNVLQIQRGSSQILEVADWRQGDYGVNLTNLPPDDEGDQGGDTDGDGDVDGDDDHDHDGVRNRDDPDWSGYRDPDPDRPDTRDDRFRDGEDQFNRSGLQLADPLVIDLDGDGLELISRDQGVLFDIDGDRVLEQVGWVGPDDGFLAIDANNNGRIDGVSELFGDPGQLGFAELATYNTHNDPWGMGGAVIDSRDADFGRLLVWRDLNGNGRSDAGELMTLTQAGITAIPLTPAASGRWIEGNLVFEGVLYDRAGGTRFAEISEVFLNYTETGRPDALGPQGGPAPGAFDLPESRGYGQLASWSRKAAADAAFRDALEDLAGLSLSQLDQATALTEKLLIAWADAEGITPGSRGGAFAADKLAVLEALFGRGWVDTTGATNPTARSATLLQNSWDSVVATFRDRVLMQGPMQTLFPQAVYDFASDAVDLNSDLAGVLSALAGLTPDQRLSILGAIEPILTQNGEQLGLFPGQAQQELARMSAEFSDEQAIYAQVLRAFSGLGREVLVPSSDPNNYVYLPDARVVQGTAYSDRVTVAGSGASLLHGHGGDDRLFAYGDGTYIFGGDGRDIIGNPGEMTNAGSYGTFYGGAGDDWLTTGTPSIGGGWSVVAVGNRLFGGDGNDEISISGYSMNDGVVGWGAFRCEAFGGDGDDYLSLGGLRITGFGDAGNDTLLLASGQYVVADGGTGDDNFRFGYWGFGTVSNSTAIGGAGNDTFILDYGPHHRMLTLLGGEGSDTVRGIAVNTTIDLGTGDDYAEIGFSDPHQDYDSVLLGGDGNDVLIIQSTTDNYYHQSTSATDVRIDGGAGDDRITIRPHTTGGPDALKIWTSAGHDQITFDGGVGVLRVARLAGDTDTVAFTNGGRATIDLTAFSEILGVFDLTATITPGQAVLRLPSGQTLTVIRAGLTSLSDLTFRFFDTGLITQNGTSGADILNGNDGPDILLGADGDDRLSGGGGLDRLVGGNGLDRLSGGAGDDILLGEAGDDTLLGGAGLDRLDGGVGIDTADYSAAAGGVTASLTTGSASNDGDGATDTFSGIENLTGSAFADTLTGSGANNVLIGGAGNDQLSGLNGDDILRGGAGVDVLNGGGGIDTVDYSTAGSGVRAQLNANASTNDGDGGTDTFIGVENLTGSAFSDVLIGDGNANVLRGGLGADTLLGLGGNDVLWGGAGALNTLQGGLGDDLYVLEAADSIVENVGEGVDTVDARINVHTLAANIENLVFGGTGNFTGTGNAGNNVITGGGGDDNLRGRGGVDVLNGGGGVDTVDYTLAAAGVTARLDLNRATNDGDGATDTFTGVENLTGSNFNDLLIGDAGANVLMGGIGTDTLLGLGGDDILMGGSGGGNNQLQGGAGNDWYILDAFDTVVELAGEGVDTVEARVGSYTLAANVENLLYTGPGSFVGSGNALNNIITGGDRGDILRGGGGNDTINGGLGSDEVQFRGSRAQYTVTTEGAGYRIVDTVAGRDGSTFVSSVEVLRFLTGNTTTALTYPPVAAASSWAMDKDDERLVSPLIDDQPVVLPPLQDKGFKDHGPLVLPGLGFDKVTFETPLVRPVIEDLLIEAPVLAQGPVHGLADGFGEGGLRDWII